jgi:RNA polymerase sigma-70 factor (ECF subfamily)
LSIRPIPNENEILSKIASGDTRAFTFLFDAYYKHLGQFVFRLTESIEAAEEIVQDVFVKIWSKRQDLPRIDSFNEYLFIVTRNRTYRFLREKAKAHLRQQEWEKQYQEELCLPDVLSPQDELCLRIDKLIQQLPPQQRKVYELSRIDRLKHSEIAKALNISPETVKKHIMSANKFIKNSFDAENELFYLLFLMLSVFIYKK